MYNQMNFNNLIDCFENSKGHNVELRIRQLELMNHIFVTNYNYLKNFFLHVKKEENAIEIIKTGNQDSFDTFSFELTRHFFNFIMATKAYIDQTRRWVNTYYDNTDFKKKYSDEVKNTFANNILCKFIQDLRNYQTHYMIPFTAYSASFSTKEPFSFKISLDKNKLMEYKKWTVDSISYINSYEKDINVETFCTDYYVLVKDFYENFFSEIIKYHKKDLDDLKVIKNELSKRQPKLEPLYFDK